MGYILVVEDDESIREMLKITLNDYGLRAKTAADCKEASIQLSKNKPDLIILDYMLGVNTCDPIIEEAMEFDPPVPILMCSAWHKIEEIAKRNNIPWVLKKPFEMEALTQLIKAILPNSMIKD